MHWTRLEGVIPILHERYIWDKVTGDRLGVHPLLWFYQHRHWELKVPITAEIILIFWRK